MTTQILSAVVFVLGVAVVVVVVITSRAANRAAWRAGYWQGKADVHQSLNDRLVENSDYLEGHPDELGRLLTEWYADEVVSDRALAMAQGLTEKECQ